VFLSFLESRKIFPSEGQQHKVHCTGRRMAKHSGRQRPRILRTGRRGLHRVWYFQGRARISSIRDPHSVWRGQERGWTHRQTVSLFSKLGFLTPGIDTLVR